jgi:hypothetical protein
MIAQGQCTIFKQNLLNGLENFTSGTYKIALYTSLANLDSTTTVYTTSGEVVGAGYTAGGKTLVNIPPASGNGAAYVSFQNVNWSGSSFTTRAALIYNGVTNAAVCVLDFGSDKTSSNFTITFPAATSTTAVLIFN